MIIEMRLLVIVCVCGWVCLMMLSILMSGKLVFVICVLVSNVFGLCVR